jgi:Flp pilus assembly pilin Flp
VLTVQAPHHLTSGTFLPVEEECGVFDDFTFRKGVVQMLNLLKNLHKEESGQDLIEYALIGLIVALGAIAGMGKLAGSLNNEFSKIASSLT